MSKLENNEVLLYLSGQPVLVKECNVIITQPTIKQIAAIGEEDFLIAVQSLSNVESLIAPVREQGNSELEFYSDFQLFLAIVVNDERIKKSLDIFFELIFPQYTLKVTENDIQIFLKENEKQIIGMINPYNFEPFTEIVKKLFSISVGKEKEIEYNPEGDRASEIARKLKAGREKIKKIKQANGEDVGSLFGTYISILSIGNSMDMNILFDYTPFQIYDSFTRYWAKVGSDFYSKISTTPLMDVSKIEKPEEWSRNLYN